ncbi:MAG: DUF1674 domain-containing protein [Alphaproteobacteria bacterium]|jgi:hypothetical protein|nr:DUF1674 domain-containing protein [Alphaproteobacteria bacterium]MDP6566938.1 DUF1674 domain-containing protein [Alphaproteobacteria bacterium]MDP6816289.1 DUF1674 domain-containing protein [Alphaproteobacteria bacterium]
MTDKPNHEGEPKSKQSTVDAGDRPPAKDKAKRPKEIGGPKGPEPTRYGDWERNGIVSDF